MFTKYSKKNAKLANSVNQFCDHREECTNSHCKLQTRDTKVVIASEDIAYSDHRHCEQFKHAEGGTSGADIIETGVWK